VQTYVDDEINFVELTKYLYYKLACGRDDSLEESEVQEMQFVSCANFMRSAVLEIHYRST
jgi:hypothetical protein